MDDEWFSAIHSLVPPSATMLAIARVFADGPLLVAVFVLAVMVAQPNRSFGISALKAGAAAAIGLLANFLIGYFWYRPPTVRRRNWPGVDSARADKQFSE